jgi:O-antigen ligase
MGWASLLGWLMVSSLWAIRGIGSQQEIILLVGMLITGVASLLAISQTALRNLIPALYVVGLCTAFFVFVGYARAGSLQGYGELIHSNYLVVARVLGLGAVASSLQLLTARERPMYLWIATVITLVGLAMSLARGALLSTLGILLLTGLFLSTRMSVRRETIWTWLSSRLKKASIGLGVFALIGGMVFVALKIERTARRLRRLFSGNELEAGGRGALWMTSIENIVQTPVSGYGLGTSGIMAGAHEGHYPHNLFLQVWLDGGIVAFVLLFGLVAFPFILALWHLWRGRLASNRWIVYLGLFLFLILEYSKSINFYSGRLLLVMGMAAVWGVWIEVRRPVAGGK